MPATHAPTSLIDSRYAAWRLLVTLTLVTLGNSGMYVVAVVLPAVQVEFGIGRADASFPYTLMMVALGLGGVWMGRIADRRGIAPVLGVGAVAIAAGYALAAQCHNIWTFGLVHGVLLGMLGGAATFAPLIADTALWWNKRRGFAVAICACGNYLAGTVWPPLVQWGIEHWGWRTTYLAMGLICGLGIGALSLCMRLRAPHSTTPAASPGHDADPAPSADASGSRPFGMSQNSAQALLFLAGVACCVAMSMPQVHIVAYCVDLGFGAGRGAEMLSLMLACGIASRLIFGAISDRVGGLRTLLLGSALQGVALLMFLPVQGLVPLYVVSALFGLFQGGIVPAYAIIVREHFPAQQVGARVGWVTMATLVGMALGGWMSGWVFDLTGSYLAAFVNGSAWNMLNLCIIGFLLYRVRQARISSVPASAASRH